MYNEQCEMYNERPVCQQVTQLFISHSTFYIYLGTRQA